MEQIFVYGSLRKGMYNYKKYLEGKSRFISYGYVKGDLYSLQDVPYPALLPGDHDILGEIYEIDEDTARLIDDLEGYQKNQGENDYDKVEMEIWIKEQNMSMVLPVYMFNMKREDNQRMIDQHITCNDFLLYTNEM